MTKTLLRAAALSCALLASTALVTPAAAQSYASRPAPVAQSVDGNGVDLLTGRFTTSWSFGEAESAAHGLSFRRTFTNGEWYDSIEGAIYLTDTPDTLAVTVGGSTRRFTLADGAYGAAEPRGDTLILQSGLFVYTDRDGTRYQFTKMNRPELPEGLLTRVKMPSGEELGYRWTFAEFPTSQDEEAGIMYRYRLQSVQSSSGYQMRFTYESEQTDFWSGEAWEAMSAATVVNSAVDYCDPVATSCNYSRSWPTMTTDSIVYNQDAAGRRTNYRYDQTGRLAGIIAPGSTTDRVTVTYHGTSDLVAAVTTPAGTWSYAYSDSGNARSVTITDPLGKQRSIVSDIAMKRVTSATDELGRTTGYSYYPNGRAQRITAPELNYVEYGYDARGNVTSTRAVAKPGSNLADIETSAEYPTTCASAVTCNQPTRTIDARLNATEYTYDQSHGGLLTVTLPAAPNGIRPQRWMTYEPFQARYKDAAGNFIASGVPTYRLTAVSECQTLANCAGTAEEVKTTLAYGPSTGPNNLLPTSTTSGAGDGSLTATQTTTYEATGDVSTVDGPLDGPADTTWFRYDAARQRIGVVSPDPDGAGPLPRRAVRTSYDAEGQAWRVELGTATAQTAAAQDAMTVQERLETSFDQGRPVTATRIVGGLVRGRTETNYDAAGRVLCVAIRMDESDFGSGLVGACDQDPTPGAAGPDRISRNSYDDTGRVTGVRSAVGVNGANDPGILDVRSTYTPNGQLESATDGETNHTFYYYDGHDRLRRTQYPMPGQAANSSNPADYEERSYDAAGDLVAFRNRANETTNFSYDALGRMTLKDAPGTEPDLSYGYDLLGRMTSASRPGHALTFGYDGLGRLRTQTGPFGTYTASYDKAGRRTGLTHPDGFYVEYDLLTTGETWRIRENGGNMLATFGYDDRGRRTSLTRGNGTSTSYSYDDPAGRLSQMSHDMPASPAHGLTLGFSYNPAGQIASNSRSNDLYRFNATPATTTETANGLNQLAARNGAALQFDGRGNMTNDGERAYTYSSENRLVSAGNAGFFYDPLGRLSGTGAATASQPSVHSEWMGEELVAERSSTGAVARRHVFAPGIDEPIVWYEGSGTSDRRYLHADERGSIVATSDGTGAVLNVNSYDEYGRTSSSDSLYAPRFGYAGQRYFSSLRIYYSRARMLHPETGRFMQADPIGYGDGMNMYAYVGGDPINSTDPSGLGEVCTPDPGSRIPRCVYVDADSDGNFRDNDVDAGFQRSFSALFHNFIIDNPGAYLRFAESPVRNTSLLVRVGRAALTPIAIVSCALTGPMCGLSQNEDTNARYLLTHYTTEQGLAGILATQTIRASLVSRGDARYGDGVYLTDIIPGTRTSAQIARALIRIPNMHRFTHFVTIDVRGLTVQNPAPHIYLIPTTGGVRIGTRIVASGRN